MTQTIRILHIIGLVGAGKTTFIERYLAKYPVFDIKRVYHESNFTPQDIKDPAKYGQFASAIRFHLTNAIESIKKSEGEYLIIESSGINQTINAFVTAYDRLTLWIQSKYHLKAVKYREYAANLNRAIINALDRGTIRYDLVFDWSRKSFLDHMPAIYGALFPDEIKEG